TIPALAVNAPVIIGTPLVAETSITAGLSLTATDVVVVKTNINRIKNPADNSTAIIPGGIGSYSATVSASPSSLIQFMSVNGVSPFNNLTFDNVTGVFSVGSVSSPVQPNNTTLAEIVPILTGNSTTSVRLTVAYQAIGSANPPGLNVPEERSHTVTYMRGDAKEDGTVDIFDALFIAQYIVGQRSLTGINPLNAASVKHDGTNGDSIDIFDALFIAQYIVGQKNAYYQ
ncbi:MAG: dockerin type I repeat-containing protein, partial [Chloroflexota bacterium]